jgi:hypothetical protein
MAEFQWWLLIVGLVAGGGLVAVVSMEARRREEDLTELERRAEATWIAEQLARSDAELDSYTVEVVLRAHREYLSLPPPDRLIVEGEPDLYNAARRAREPDLDLDRELDGDPDRASDEVRHNGRRRPDEDLPDAAEEHAATRQQAHAGADREQRAD